jgi:hypothetical protein
MIDIKNANIYSSKQSPELESESDRLFSFEEIDFPTEVSIIDNSTTEEVYFSHTDHKTKKDLLKSEKNQ